MKTRQSPTQIAKNIVLLFVLLISFAMSAQEKGVQLAHNFSKRTVFYPENTRIILKTKAGDKHVGYYSIIDDATISINGIPIPLDDISKLKRRSKEGVIMRPVLVFFGGTAIGGAVAGALAGGYGYLATVALTPLGMGMLLPVILTSNHKSPDWKYSIMTRTDNPQK